MRKIFLLILTIFVTSASYAGWTNLNTGINDNLTGVVFWGNKGLVAGSHGIYYTINGGSGPASWMRFNITTNHNDSLLYNRTKFRHAYAATISSYGSNKAVVCGADTINNKSVIMLIDFTAFTYTLINTGINGSGFLNKISFSSQDNSYYVVGDNGQFVKFIYNGTGFNAIASPSAVNFNSVSFSGANFCIGTNGLVINGTSNGNVYTYTNTTSSSNNYKDAVCLGVSYSYAVGNDYFKWLFNGLTQLSNYDFGNLNGSCIFQYQNLNYVGTDHGIFKSISSPHEFLEWQPSSATYKIDAIWSSYNGSMYACGKNGVVLVTTDGGGDTKPLAKLNLSGGCVNAVVNMNAITGSSNSCSWYVNNALLFSACGTSFQTSFASVGQYTVQLQVSNNAGLQDTSIQIINIVDYPKINKPVTLNKSIVCRQEPLVITVDSSQQNVYYRLFKYGNIFHYGNSAPGSGSAISFTSAPVSQTGNYYIQAISTLAQCTKNFTDTIKIVAEQTQANFHVATVNAAISEPVNIYQNCVDAQNYQWQFSGGVPSISASSVANPTLSYGSAGPTSAKLICWSNHGCYDTLQKAGPSIFVQPLTPDSCWTMVNQAPDPTWEGHYDYELGQLSPSASGFLVSGSYYKESFASRHGDSLKLSGTGGAYVGKYDVNGVLKWLNYSVQPDYNNSPGMNTRDAIYSVKEDSKGNIYITGRTSAYFYDNKGDSILLHENHFLGSDNNCFIAKLDSSGKLLWRVVGYRIGRAQNITVDKSDNIIFRQELGSGTTVFELNGVPNYTLTLASTGGTYNSYNLIKMSSSGNILWNVEANSNWSNSSSVGALEIDKSNHIYLTGSYHTDLNIYSANSSTYTSFPSSTSLQGYKLFVVKYDSLGNVIWKMNALTKGTVNNYGVAPRSMCMDDKGNMYISGSNDMDIAAKFMIYNADGTQDSTIRGRYFVMKINKDGICKWINSSQNIFVGTGLDIVINGSEVSALGVGSSYSNATTGLFDSQDGTSTALTIGSSDYFIAVYDTLGNLKKIMKNGANSYNPNTLQNWIMNMIRNTNGDYFVASYSRFFLGQSNYTTFGTTIPSMNGYDVSITKVSGASCGLLTLPGSTVSCTSPTLNVNSGSICAGSVATITVNGADTYSWPAGSGFAATTGSIVSVNPTVTSAYTVTGTRGVCMTTTIIVIPIVPNPTLSVNSVSVCESYSAVLNASGLASYTWNPPATNNGTIVVSPSSTTIYTVSGNTPGCPGTYSAIATVTVWPLPQLSVPSASVCAGHLITLQASGADTYIWNPGFQSGSSIVVLPGVSSNYTITGRSLKGCPKTVIATVSVIPNPTITASASNSIICSGHSVVLSAAGGNSYTWTNGVVDGIAFTPTATAIYTVTGSVASCTAAAAVSVTVNSCTGIEEYEKNGTLAVYPNPVNNLLYIDGPNAEDMQVQLINTLGQTVYYSVKNGLVSLQGLSPGIYYLFIYKYNRLYYQTKLFKE